MKAKEASANWDAVASNYDIAAFTFEPFAQWLASECQARAGERALDVGCGTGISTLALASRMKSEEPNGCSSSELVGVDVSKKMIQIAQRKAVESDFNVNFLVASAEQLSFHDESFDVVICNFGPHLFADSTQALKEMAKTLKSGGRLGFTVPGEKHVQEFVNALISVLKSEGLLEIFMQKGMLRMTHQRVNEMLQRAGLSNAKVIQKELQFQMNTVGEYANVLEVRGAKGRMLNRLPENRRFEIWQKTIAQIKREFPNNLPLTCHCYGVFWRKT